MTRAVAIDTETTGLNAWTGARPFAVSAYDGDEEWYWEWTVNPRTRKPRIRQRDVREIRELCLEPGTRKRFWNAKYDYLMLRSIGVDMRECVDRGEVDEVSFMARAVNNLEFAYRLKPLAKKYVDFPDDDEQALRAAVVRCRRVAKKLGWNKADDVEGDYWMPFTLSVLHPELLPEEVDLEVCRRYAVNDAIRTWELGEMYEYGMDDLDVRGTYAAEMALWPVTLGMEERGAMIDEARLEECRAACEEKIRSSMATLVDASGREDFNPNSPKQVVDLLFEGAPLSLPVLKRTKTGQPKTDAEALSPHKGDPIVDALFTVRANEQALKLFFNKYADLATRDERGAMILHPGYRQWGTLTGRYSCSEPNMQQVSDPNTTNSRAAEYVVDVRQVFVPRPGHVWYCPDYSQVEVVIFADVSGEESLIEAIRRGDDIHAATAERIWGGPDCPRRDEVCRELGQGDRKRGEALMEEHGWMVTEAEVAAGLKVFRKRAKSVTFTKVFGGGPLALMSWIGVSKPEAREILNAYDDAFPTMVERMAEIERRGKADGYVLNPFGRRLAVDPWNAYRAVNHIVQSAAADLMKRGMRSCAEYLDDLGIDARILMTIHDELIFEFRREHAYRRVLRGICDRMSDHGEVFSVDTPVDMDKVLTRWSEKVKVDL